MKGRNFKLKLKISINTVYGKWSLRAGGAVLGETTKALQLQEGDKNAVLFFPRQDLAIAFFEKTGHKTTCPHKGTAGYYSIITKSQTLENTAFEFINPRPQVKDLLNYGAFVPNDAVIIERL